MPIDPSLLPPAASPDESVAGQARLPVARVDASPLSSATPNIGHTLLFGTLVALAGFLIGLLFQLSLMHLASHLHEPAEQMQTDPLLVIPVEALIYAIAGAASFLIFPLFWNRPFAQGIHWRAFIVRRRLRLLVGIGVATSVVVQLLSNFLPIPKELPIDKFFTHPARRLAHRHLRCHRRARIRRAGLPRLPAAFARQRMGLGGAARTQAA